MTKRLRRRPVQKATPRSNPERALQASVFDLIRFNRVPMLIAFHAFNEGKRAARTQGFYQRIGMLPGVADVCLVLPGGNAAFLELKAPSGHSTQGQRAFGRECVANGAPYAVARSIEEAAEILHAWGAIRTNPLAPVREERAAA